jgi:hypothetical protein
VDTQAGCTGNFAGIAEASNRLKQHEDHTLTDKKTIKRVPGLPRHPKHDEMSGMMKDWYYHVPFEGTLFPVRSDPDIEADEAEQQSSSDITARSIEMANAAEVGLFAGVDRAIDKTLGTDRSEFGNREKAAGFVTIASAKYLSGAENRKKVRVLGDIYDLLEKTGQELRCPMTNYGLPEEPGSFHRSTRPLKFH